MTEKELKQNLEKLELNLSSIDTQIDNAKDSNLVILFAGIPGSGKTTLAKNLQKEFNGFRITKDEIWANSIQPLFKNDLSLEDRNKVADEFIKNKSIKAIKQGKLLIYDRNVDRAYEDLLKELDKLNCQKFLINIEIDRETVEERIDYRENNEETANDYKKNLDRWVKEHEEFIKNYGSEIDFTIHQHSYQFEYPALLNTIFQNLN